MAKFRISNPFVGAAIEMGEWRPPKSKPRLFQTAETLQEDIGAWEEACRVRKEKIAAAQAKRPKDRPGFSWVTHLAPRFYWSKIPKSLEGDALLEAIVTVAPDDADVLERILYTLKHFVSAESREPLIAAIAEELSVSPEEVKARILAYKPREVQIDE